MARPLSSALAVIALCTALAPAAALNADPDFQRHIQNPATIARLQSEGWPVRMDDGRAISVPTTDAECSTMADLYRQKRQRLLDHSRNMKRAIMADAKTTPAQKRVLLDKLRNTMIKRGKIVGKKYYAPVVMYLSESVNFSKRGAGGADARMKINLAIGVSPGSDGWGGAWSDIDLQGSPSYVDEFRKRMDKVIGGTDVDAGAGYLTEQTLDVTLHKMGRPGMEEYEKVGSTAYEEKLRVDADSPETSNSALMARDQEGRVLVEVNDYMKKSEIGLKTDPLTLLDQPMQLKGMAKGLYKTLKTVPMKITEVQECLRRSGLEMDAGDFRSALEKLKLDGMAFTPDAVGLTPENIEAFQKSIETLYVTCHERVRTQALAEMTTLKQKILVAETAGDKAEATRLRKRYIDSQMRIVESTEANRRRYTGFQDLGPALKGIRAEIAPVHGQMKVRGELARFLSLMKGSRWQRRLAVLVLNHVASKSPESARGALDAAMEMDADGVLATDPEVMRIRDDLQRLQDGSAGKSPMEREAAVLAFANRCRARVAKVNSFLAADLKRSRTGAIAGAVVDKWGGVEEALAYWNAFEADGLEGLATEIVRFRIPLLENVVSGRPLLAAWEVICMICPNAGIYYAAFNYTWQLTLMGVDHFWSAQLDSHLDELYANAKWERIGTEQFESAAIDKWRLVRTELDRRPLLRIDFLSLADGATLGSVELETVLRLTVAKEDPVLNTLDEIARHDDVGRRLLRHLHGKYEERWEDVRKWWAKEALLRLEERKQAEAALLGKQLLPIMFQLDHVLRELESEDLVRGQMYFSEYTKSEKAWMFWVSVRTWLSDGSATLFSESDDASNAIVQRLAAKEIRYLRQYREVLEMRRKVEELTGLADAKDGPLRQLTGPFFLLGDPEKDLQRARYWETKVERLHESSHEQLLSIKQGFFPDAALDTEFDQRVLGELMQARTWFESWGQAHKVLTTWHSPEQWSAARDLLAPFYSRETWHDAFLALWDKATAEVRQLAKRVLSDRTYPTMRRQHRTRIDALIAEFRAHYAGEARGRAVVHVRLHDGAQPTQQPIQGCEVSWVVTGERAVETRPGTYEFRGLPAGFCRVLAQADGFTDGQGNPAAAANLTIPAEPTGPPPAVNLHLHADELALTGSVLDDRGDAVKHADVSLAGSTSRVVVVSTTTDGTFAFVPVAPGTHRVSASARGFRPAAERAVAVELPTAAGAAPAPVHFALEPMFSTVEIRLRDEHGIEVPGARVTLGEHRGRSDGSGTVVFAGVRPDPITPVHVVADGYTTLNDAIAVLPESEPSTILHTLTLSGGISLNVVVRELDSETLVEGARVGAWHANEIVHATTGTDGLARLKGLPPSFVYLTVEGKGFGTRGNIEVDLRDVPAGDTREKTVFVEFGMQLDVFVKDAQGELIPGASVTLDGGPDRFAPTGRATLVPLREGEHVIRAKAPGHIEATLGYTAAPLAMQKDSMTVLLQQGMSIRVEVRDPAGALLRQPRSTIRLVRDGEIIATADGPTHLFAGLSPGSYLAGAAAPGAGISMSETVVLREAPEHHVLTVRLGHLCAIQAHVRSADPSVREVPEHASVELIGPRVRASAVGRIVQFDGLLPGIYTLHVSAPGFEPARLSALFPATESGQVLRTTIHLVPEPGVQPPPDDPLDDPPDQPPPPDPPDWERDPAPPPLDPPDTIRDIPGDKTRPPPTDPRSMQTVSVWCQAPARVRVESSGGRSEEVEKTIPFNGTMVANADQRVPITWSDNSFSGSRGPWTISGNVSADGKTVLSVQLRYRDSVSRELRDGVEIETTTTSSCSARNLKFARAVYGPVFELDADAWGSNVSGLAYAEVHVAKYPADFRIPAYRNQTERRVTTFLTVTEDEWMQPNCSVSFGPARTR